MRLLPTRLKAGFFWYSSPRLYLVWQLLLREGVARTRGTLLGMAWLFIQPALQVSALWLLFDGILHARSGGVGGSLQYFLIAMTFWLPVQDVCSRSLMVLSDYGSIYQRTVFPIHVLPLIPVLLSFLIFGPIALLISGLFSGWTGLLSGLMLQLLIFLGLLPVAYGLSILGLFIRESRQVIPFLLTVLLYLSPILYASAAYPSWLAPWEKLNPVADLVDFGTSLILEGRIEIIPILRLFLGWVLMIAIIWPIFYRAMPYVREEL